MKKFNRLGTTINEAFNLTDVAWKKLWARAGAYTLIGMSRENTPVGEVLGWVEDEQAKNPETANALLWLIGQEFGATHDTAPMNLPTGTQLLYSDLHGRVEERQIPYTPENIDKIVEVIEELILEKELQEQE